LPNLFREDFQMLDGGLQCHSFRFAIGGGLGVGLQLC